MSKRLLGLGLWTVLILIPAWVFAHGNRPLPRYFYQDPSDNNVQVLVSSDQGLHLTLDGGQAWHWVCEDILGYDAYTFAIAGEPNADPRGRTWIVGGIGLTQDDQPVSIDGIYISHDGGCNWSAPEGVLAGQWASAISVHPGKQSEVLISTQHVTEPNGIAISEDGGATWAWTELSALEDDVSNRNRWINALVRAPSEPETLYASSVSAMHSSFDGGRTWTTWGETLINDSSDQLQVHKADPSEPNTVYFSAFKAQGRTLYVSRDGGESHQPLLEAGTREFSSLAITTSPEGARQLVVGTRLGVVHRSDDEGETWTSEDTFVPIECLEIDLNDPELIYMCSNIWAQSPTQPRFALGTSKDSLAQVEPWFAYADILGHIACPEDSQVNQICIPLDTPDTSNGTADVGIDADSSSVPDAGADTSTDDAQTSDVETGGGSDGCACAAVQQQRSVPFGLGIVVVSLLVLGVVRRKRTERGAVHQST